MDLTVLGCSGSYPDERTACSGYLLRQDGYTVYMDAGNGTLHALQKAISYRDVDAVVLSHAHPDHCADMYPFFYALLFAELGRTVPVVTAPGVRAKLEALVGADSIDRFRSLMAWHELSPGDVTELGPFRLEAFDAAHSIVNDTYRITADGRTLCYSGDTGPNPHLARAAAGADLFLCEASWLEEHRGLMAPIHLTAGEAGEAARAAGVGRLILTHIWPENDLARVREEAAATYGGDIELAIETETTTI